MSNSWKITQDPIDCKDKLKELKFSNQIFEFEKEGSK